jgi:hypothetical protein
MLKPLITKDSHKLDVYRFDVEHINDDLYEVSINNTISWDIMNLKVTKEELLGLADFINRMTGMNNETTSS